ncbi:hypothetical protein GJ685_09405 [Chlorobium phaeovibrioides]|uniref:DUF91 domain-containing protein n=1 Tax=Chlorobium phaeovibrioides TaxID=1094 RepID=A0ABW9UWN3_CHLPH|nr:hypothetical protein [Chlorobium phaeovibrioides]MWV55261.1 hypothetical protein [Chlorobium phaeovibrioides]
MIDVGRFAGCVCQKMRSQNAELGLCDGEFGFSEKGKKVRLELRGDEEGVALMLDGCVFTDDGLPRCDGLFLFQKRGKKAAILIELKGAWHIEEAFAQLAYVHHERAEYAEIVGVLERDGPGKVQHFAYIVSNGTMDKPQKERMEEAHGIRVKEILSCDSSSTIPSIRL